MPRSLNIALGKVVQRAARLRGGGSALPGLFIEKIDKNFVKDTLAQLPYGVVVISGTNGKTTTAKIVTELLEGQGLRVFTNRTGSNFIRGVASALLAAITPKGTLNADIAVLELDEAHGVHFVHTVAPTYSLILNVMRDQLDRFGEIDSTAKLLQAIADATTQSVILNANDERIAAIHTKVKGEQTATFFGLDKQLIDTFPSDDALYGRATKKQRTPKTTVSLTAIHEQSAVFTINGKTFETAVQLKGVYNLLNAAAALALVQIILPKSSPKKLIATLSGIAPAFGRGEQLVVKGQPLELVLVKNPSGFRLGLTSFSPDGHKTMIAINDNYADGRDLSWLWDVDFSSLQPAGVAAVSGVRAHDMALRLQYDEVAIDFIEPTLPKALRRFIKENAGSPKRIYCTYTAMLALRRELQKITTVEVVS